MDTNEDLLAFVREKDDERLLFVFNLRRGPQSLDLPTHLVVKEPLAMPGSKAVLETGTIRFEALDGFCGRL
ncbi:hypothetical protein D3C72_2452090 [compost metagenome]